MEKEKVNDDGKLDPENSSDFSEHFNLLELLETQYTLSPLALKSLWVGNSNEDEEEQYGKMKSDINYRKKMEKIQANCFFGLWKKLAENKRKLTTVQRLFSAKATHVNTRDEDEYTPLH